jgi:tryptophanyl-tRNA synthetase
MASEAEAAPAEGQSSTAVPVPPPPVKKERVVTVECPPAVATAYLILRGAILAVTGAVGAEVGPNADKTSANPLLPSVSVLQATFLKEKALTGKFSVNLGKKLGDCCEMDLPETTQGAEALLNAIEEAANRIVAENRPIVGWTVSKSDTSFVGGNCALDATHAKLADNAMLTVSYIQDWVLAVPPLGGLPYATTNGGGGVLQRIVLDRAQCSVSASSTKARSKADITLKFLVIEQGNGTDTTPETAPLRNNLDTRPPNWGVLEQAKCRCPEGIALRDSFLLAAAAAAAATATPPAEDQPTAMAASAAFAPLAEHAVSDTNGLENKNANSNDDDDDMVVNVEEVKGKIDYTKLVDKFGSTLIDDDLLAQLEAETVGKGRVPNLHRFLRRGMFFSHRDLHNLLAAVRQGTPMYLYTGRGPSSESMHLGHLIPFLFTKWLQDAFDAPLVVQMTDDEKFIFKGVYDDQTGDDLDRFAALTIENARDIIACGFDYKKTFLFSDLDYVGVMYPNIVRIWKAVTTNAVTNIFGFDGSSNIGKIAFPAIQAAPSFASSFPTVLQANRQSDHVCLIPCAIDQDPYFRMTRDVAHKLVSKKHKLNGKPALIHSKFFPPLQGATGKMSSSDENSAIFLTDSPEDIHRKIMHHAFSGGRETKIKQQELGADLEVDVSYQWLRFFLEDDDELAAIGESYGSGKGDYWSTGSVKARLIALLQQLVSEHQERRARITDEEVRKWMKERSIV